MAVGVLAGAAGAWATEAVRVVAGRNEHCVLRDRVYRSAQPDGDNVRELVRRHGIRTIINLRGLCADFPWYADETRAVHDHDLSQEDITLSANRLPPPQELRRLVEALDRVEYPILIHCRRGSDRTGLVSALILLLYSDADLATARKQCSPRYGHLRVLSTARMDEFFDAYEAWLARRGEPHSPARFRHWVLKDYTPGPAAAELELLEPLRLFRVGEAPVIRVRAWNRSSEPWQFRPGSYAGVHVRFIVFPPPGAPPADERTGFFERVVPPGGSIDLTLSLPRFVTRGVYGLLVDMEGPNHTSFMQAGSKPLDLELYVRE